jgi:hypothetical protein
MDRGYYAYSIMSKKLTVPQRYVLQTAADHVVLQVGGLDGVNVKRSVVARMVRDGLLESWPLATFFGDGYRLTEAGKAALATTK